MLKGKIIAYVSFINMYTERAFKDITVTIVA